MGQFNLGSLNNSGSATLVVSAGDPETLVLNHSTKNTVYIGTSSSVGSGNLLDSTPLDPYASIVVNGNADVWAIAAIPTQPATVYTYQNAINWTPKAVQPNILDPNAPWGPGTGNHNVTLNVPQGAQGLVIACSTLISFSSLIVTGVQSGFTYYNGGSTSLQENQVWIPILSDVDSTVTVSVGIATAAPVSFVWIMVPFVSGFVESGQVGDVNIKSVGTFSGTIPVSGSVSITGTPNVSVTNTPGVNVTQIGGVATGGGYFSTYETNKAVCSNQEPNSFNVTLAANAISVLLPAAVGVQYFLHTLWCQINSSDMLSYHLQDTNGNDLGVFINTVAGTPANAFHPPNPPFDFKGAVLPTGVGVQIKNGGANTEAFVGTITYSK